MTDAEWEEFLRWMQTHTAFNRLNHAELQAAFERAAEQGFSVVKGLPAEDAPPMWANQQ
jgi:hypothetical protein